MDNKQLTNVNQYAVTDMMVPTIKLQVSKCICN